ncbi:MAG TPA: sulfate ABC transporter ATP-binding protein [Epulopiscium sp.]|nr:sulfate ABC transporter ATP-binding protein [Candidatus Epulonipiscium sp.]
MHIQVTNIFKNYGDFKAADRVSFQIEKGQLIGLLGPSGSGKTTILRMIAGLETPDSGDILIDGVKINDLPPGERGIGFVFQNYALFRHMSIYDNIAFGLKVQKIDKNTIDQRVKELLLLIGLEGLDKRYPHQLSGGQRQRVAFARAIAPRPKVLLLDEPFAAIDCKIRKELRTWLKEMITKLGITSIFVTHDQEEAVELADEIIVTNKGRIEQQGIPSEIYKNPATPFVAQFIGESTIVEDYQALKGFKEINKGKKAVIRPEFIQIEKDSKEILTPSAAEKGVVKEILFKGHHLEITVTVGHLSLVGSRTLEQEPLTVGEEVLVLVHRLYVFDDLKAQVVENKLKTDPMPIFI